jgi:tRNA A-37 threonylcarbamoyl transferase component Bud32
LQRFTPCPREPGTADAGRSLAVGGLKLHLCLTMDLMDRLRTSLGDDFEIVRPLGEGTVAKVFLAREKGLDRPVAIKVMKSALALDETARKRFLREARLSAKIQHPNVVSVHRVGELEGDGRPYLIMEYIDGRTFEDVLAAAGPLGEDDVRRVLGEVCGALEAAHELGIIHRDVRPGNIMQSRDGERVVLTDFGLAGTLETGGDATRLTGQGEILGDVRYAPPEQLQGDTIQPGSDIYALAVTAYELLTGNGPFPDETRPAALIKAHLTGEPAPLRRLRPGAAVDLEDALLRCLQKKPEQRPAARVLGQRLSADGEGPPPDGAVENFFAELKRRHVYKVGAAYGAFILVVLAFVDAALPAMPFDLPGWTDSALVLGTLAGLPIALVLGWFYDITDSGVRRTRSEGVAPRGTRLILGAAVLVILIVAGVLAWWFGLR